MVMFKANIYSQLGASNHIEEERQSEDFYSTNPKAVKVLIDKLKELNIEIPETIIEPSVGMGHIAKVFEKYGHKIEAYDILDRGYPATIQDFLQLKELKCKTAKMFVQNPPYGLGIEFIEKSLNFCSNNEYVCALLKIQFLESQSRYEFFKENPPKYVSVFVRRTYCLKDGKDKDKPSAAMCYAWFIWQKGYKGYPMITWCNTGEEKQDVEEW